MPRLRNVGDYSGPTRWLRGNPGLYALTFVALILPSLDVASAQESERVEPHFEVIFELNLTPDKEAEGLGAVSLSNQVRMPGGKWEDTLFTGRGCVRGPFASSAITFRASPTWNVRAFEVSCRKLSKDDAVSLIEWRGNLEGGKLSGDVWITLSGTPLTVEQVSARKEADRAEARRRTPPVIVDGRVFNGHVIEQVVRLADKLNALLPAQGRRLHFTFTTTDVMIVPVGSWGQGNTPTTRPVDRQVVPEHPARGGPRGS